MTEKTKIEKLEAAMKRHDVGQRIILPEDQAVFIEAARAHLQTLKSGVKPYGHNHCGNCGGNGYIHDGKTEQCPECKGSCFKPTPPVDGDLDIEAEIQSILSCCLYDTRDDVEKDLRRVLSALTTNTTKDQ